MQAEQKAMPDVGAAADVRTLTTGFGGLKYTKVHRAGRFMS
jgi:hypothetical protein